MNFDRKEFYHNPHPNFDVPPLSFEEIDENGWTALAKAIVTRESGLRKYVDYAKKFKIRVSKPKTYNISKLFIYLRKSD